MKSQVESQIETLDRALEFTSKMLDRQDEAFEDRAKRIEGHDYGSMAWYRVKDQGGKMTLDRLVAEQLKIDGERIDRAIARSVRQSKTISTLPPS